MYLDIDTRLSERYHTFSFPVLPNCSLVTDSVSCTLTLVDWQRHVFLASHAFSDRQFSIVRALLERWPGEVSFQEVAVILEIERGTGNDPLPQEDLSIIKRRVEECRYHLRKFALTLRESNIGYTLLLRGETGGK